MLFYEICAKDFSVPMALVDFIPVVCFCIAAIILQREFFFKMSKGQFAVFACGTINVVIAGGLKALYKLLYACGACDFEPLNNLFFPLQAIGFLLAGIAILPMVFKKNKNVATLAVAPPVFSGTFVFIGFMVAGLLGIVVGLCIEAFKKKQYVAFALFIVSFVCSLCMGYLASKDFEQAAMNWIAEGVNVVGQASMLVGAWLYKKANAKQA